jgi:flagellar assembly factor FliW
MRIETLRFGTLEIDPAVLITLPSGLIGLPQRKRFVVLELEGGAPLGWLQCVDDPSFGVPVADPGVFRADYRIAVAAEEVAEITLDTVEDAAILIVTTIAPGGTQVTGNLRAPILINAHKRLGRQVVLDRPDLEFRVPVDPVLFAAASGRFEPSLAAAPAAAR